MLSKQKTRKKLHLTHKNVIIGFIQDAREYGSI